jgi:hypothetical protein
MRYDADVPNFLESSFAGHYVCLRKANEIWLHRDIDVAHVVEWKSEK